MEPYAETVTVFTLSVKQDLRYKSLKSHWAGWSVAANRLKLCQLSSDRPAGSVKNKDTKTKKLLASCTEMRKFTHQP